MGHKKVCFACRKAFSLYFNDAVYNKSKAINMTCPQCGGQSFLLNHKFRPPQKNDVKQWKVAEFLKDHGFFYGHAYELIDTGTYLQVPYPTTMAEAEVFVKTQKRWFQ